MAGPTVLSAIADRDVLSDETGFTHSYITVSFDEPIQHFRVSVTGVSYDTGIIVHEESKLVSDLNTKTVEQAATLTVKDIREFDGDVVAEVDYTELQQEGENKVNIYGQSQATKEWTS